MVKDINLQVEVGGLRLRNPILLASGTAGYGVEVLELLQPESVGGLVTKGISLEPWAGNPAPRIVETPAGMINAIGLQNMGLEAFLKDHLGPLEQLQERGVRIVVNVIGRGIQEYVDVVSALDAVDSIDAMELNISCPNVKEGGIHFGSSPEQAMAVTRACRAVTQKPLWVKLSPNVTDIGSMAVAVTGAGADVVSAINTVVAMEIDIESRRPALANVQGGLSGPAIRPIALHRVWQCCQAVDVPVVGIGGISDARDVLAFMMVGACAIQIGTAGYRQPGIHAEICADLKAWLGAHELHSIQDVIGTLELDTP